MSGPLEPRERALAGFRIVDLFLVSTDCRSDRGWNPDQSTSGMSYRHRLQVGTEILRQVRTPVDPALPAQNIVRYFATGELELLPASPEQGDESPPLAKLEFTFAADYACAPGMFEDAAAMSAFVPQVVADAWPYFREAAHASVARMSLPRITLPILQSGGG